LTLLAARPRSVKRAPVTPQAPATPSAPATASASPSTSAPAVASAPAEDADGRVGASADAGPAVESDRVPSAGRFLAAGVLARWLVVCGAAAVVLAPVAVFSVQQSAQLNWVRRPDLSTVATLVRDFAGITALIPVVGLLALLGCAAGPGVRRGAGLTLAVVTLPWLVVPPVLLLAGSLADPVYVERYVMFCLPARSILAAAGLIWLADLTRGAAV